MDEIVFQREKLRRELLDGIDLLDKATDSYDAAKDMPTEDFLAGLALSGCGKAVKEYCEAISERVLQRAGDKP